MKEYKKLILSDTVIIYFEENGIKVSFNEAPGNRHYEEYLEWLAEGNEPEVVQPEVING